MRDPEASTNRVLDRLEERFDAWVARDEELAAADLARAFDAGMSLDERLRAQDGGLYLLSPNGARCEVTVLGPEHVAGGDPVTRFDRLGTGVIVATEGRPPALTRLTLCQALRPWARSRRLVEIVPLSGTGAYVGRLAVAAGDHLVIDRRGEGLLVPVDAIASIRLVPGG